MSGVEQIGLTLGALGVVDNLSSILRIYGKTKQSTFQDLFAEFKILQNILAEAVLDLDELTSPPRLSAQLALERCQILGQEVQHLFEKFDGYSRMKMQIERDKLMEKCSDLKSAVLLLRDVAADSLAHDLLRRVATTNVFNGDTVYNVSSTQKSNGSRPASGDIRTKSESYSSTLNPREGTATAPAEPASFRRTTASLPATAQNESKPVTRKRTPLENLTLFNATISCLVNADLEQLPEHMRQKLTSDCDCGRRRVGFWFPVRGKWDSGSPVDIISQDVIQRAGLEHLVESAEHPWTIGLLGVSQDLTKKIALSWQLNNKEESFTQHFWVAEMPDDQRAGFDLIIGEPWLNEHGYGIIETNESRKPTFFGFFRSLRLGGTRAQKKRDKEAEDKKKREELEKLSKESEISLTNLARLSASSSTLPGTSNSISTLQTPTASSSSAAVSQQPSRQQSGSSGIQQPDAVSGASSSHS